MDASRVDANSLKSLFVKGRKGDGDVGRFSYEKFVRNETS